MRCVILESPYAGNRKLNTKYALKCMRDSLKRGEAPFVSQLLYTQVLNDNVKEERLIGMNSHHAWQNKADAMVVYTDLSISPGMREAIDKATEAGLSVEYRSLELTPRIYNE